MTAKVFEDRQWPGNWRFDDDGGRHLSGPNARERALGYADRQYHNFEEIGLDPYP